MTRRCGPWCAAIALLTSLTGPVCAVQQIADGETALASGRYDEAIDIFERLVRPARAPAAAYRGQVVALIAVGRYPEAAAAARAYSAAHPGSPELENRLGEVLYRRGRVEDARFAFTTSIEGGASDRLTAEINLAVLLHATGQYKESSRRFDRFIDLYNQSAGLTSEALTAVGIACRYLGAEDPQLFKDALRAFDEAVATDPANLEPLVQLGEMFLDKYNSTDAQATFQRVLDTNPSHPRALLGLAQSLHFDGSPRALELTEQSLAVNPNLIEAQVFLARLYLELEDTDRAEEQLTRALAVDPGSSPALAMLAAARLVSGDQKGYEDARDRALQRNPLDADLYNTVAELSAQNRLYYEAVDLARQAVSLDERSWRGHGLLGIGQMRLGAIEEGKKQLEIAFEGDPYNVWIKNTLDLLDTFARYEETRTDQFHVAIHADEAALLSPYVLSLAEEAFQKLAERYRYEPPTPIRLEIYPTHADFSVRTVGLAGLGALGVSFGPVIAMDSPSARKTGQFNWGSTLWHELAHSFTLGLSKHRIPRWFAEGLSVLEERRARPGWGDDVSLAFLMAYAEEKLLPLRELNSGFVRPRYAGQVSFSYYQASLICELIERDAGLDALLSMLIGYGEGLTTVQVFHRVLQTDLEEFDHSLDLYMKERFAGPLAALRSTRSGTSRTVPTRAEMEKRARDDVGDFSAQLTVGKILFEEGKFDEAIPYLERAKALFPDYAAADSPYWYLARFHRDRGALRRAAAELDRLTSINENHYDAHVALSLLLEQLGDSVGAAGMLDRLMYIYPLEPGTHTKLADLYRGLGHHKPAIRERRAIVALDPVDRAEALYQLALAYYEAGDIISARREVIRALEHAPSFEKAQALLLELRESKRTTVGAV